MKFFIDFIGTGFFGEGDEKTQALVKDFTVHQYNGEVLPVYEALTGEYLGLRLQNTWDHPDLGQIELYITPDGDIIYRPAGNRDTIDIEGVRNLHGIKSAHSIGEETLPAKTLVMPMDRLQSVLSKTGSYDQSDLYTHSFEPNKEYICITPPDSQSNGLQNVILVKDNGIILNIPCAIAPDGSIYFSKEGLDRSQSNILRNNIILLINQLGISVPENIDLIYSYKIHELLALLLTNRISTAANDPEHIDSRTDKFNLPVCLYCGSAIPLPDKVVSLYAWMIINRNTTPPDEIVLNAQHAIQQCGHSNCKACNAPITAIPYFRWDEGDGKFIFNGETIE